MAAAVSGEGEKRALATCMADGLHRDASITLDESEVKACEGTSFLPQKANSFALVPAYLSPSKSIKVHAHGGRYAPQLPATRREKSSVLEEFHPPIQQARRLGTLPDLGDIGLISSKLCNTWFWVDLRHLPSATIKSICNFLP
jgi:hypothetical protein